MTEGTSVPSLKHPTLRQFRVLDDGRKIQQSTYWQFGLDMLANLGSGNHPQRVSYSSGMHPIVSCDLASSGAECVGDRGSISTKYRKKGILTIESSRDRETTDATRKQVFDSLFISELSTIAEHSGCVLSWLRSTWDDPENVFAETLVPSGNCPGALIAVAEDGPVGVLTFKLHPVPRRTIDELWINAVYVVPNFRRRGVGRRLIRSAVAHSIPGFAKRLFVFTDVPNLYEPLGWKRIDFSSTFGSYTLRFEPSTTIARANGKASESIDSLTGQSRIQMPSAQANR